VGVGGVGLVVLGGVGVGVGMIVCLIEWHDRSIRASKWKQWDIDYRFR
jgi:hypothetical protein